jgi:hypothetical protein
MIVGISDGKGFTDMISKLTRQGEGEKAKKLFADFFSIHTTILDNQYWNLVKTTGDGLFFYTKNKYASYATILKTLQSLFKDLNRINIDDQNTLKARLFIFDCRDKDIIRGNDVCFHQDVKRFTKNDVFGFPLSYGFRLLSMTKEAILFTEKEFMESLKNELNSDLDIYQTKAFQINDFTFSRAIPVVFLKGIDMCGFDYEVDNDMTNKTPQWIWQILK